MRIAIILGTRPEIIKMAPVMRACQELSVPFFVLHTGQHYSPSMDAVFFEELELPQPKYNLHSGKEEYRKQIGIMVREIQRILKAEQADVAIVQGDTNSVLAGALAANKLGIKVVHHEAGLRSHDLTMPEEKNRIITDHISDLLFTPTQDAHRNLVDEEIPQEKVLHSGNTIVDAVLQNLELAKRKSRILEELHASRGGYFLVTTHRAENVDIPERLQGIMDGLALVGSRHPGTQIIFPAHPRTRGRLAQFGISVPQGVLVIDPLGFLDFLTLEGNARLIITDSGGIQEEASILKVPCVTVRDNTERPETIQARINVLAGTDPETIARCVDEMLAKEHDWKMLYGDGTAGLTIVRSITERYG